MLWTQLIILALRESPSLSAKIWLNSIDLVPSRSWENSDAYEADRYLPLTARNHDTGPTCARRSGARHHSGSHAARAIRGGYEPGDRDAERTEVYRHRDGRRRHGSGRQKGLGALYWMAVEQ